MLGRSHAPGRATRVEDFRQGRDQRVPIPPRELQGTSAARVMEVVSFACHSESANALLMCSSGYLCEMSRSNGKRDRLRTRKSSARGITPGSYWITPTIFFEPQTRSDGSSSIFAPRLN